MSELPQEPFTVKYLRWKHRSLGYKVTVTGTLVYKGLKGYYTVVVMEKDRVRTCLRCPSGKFLQDYRPIRSSKVTPKTKADILREDPFA